MRTLELSQDFADAIIDHARRELPNECCGLLVGCGWQVERIYRCTNLARSPSTYLLDPAEQLAAFRETEKDGLDLLGIYHSHTQTAAYPSRADIAKAYYPDVVYLIVALKNANQPVLRGFHITGDRVSETEVVVTPDTAEVS